MRVHWENYQGSCSRSAALGTFDGVHRGHQELLRRAVLQRPMAGSAVAVTFDYPPEQVFQDRVQLLCDFATRKKLLMAAGLDEVCWFEFDSHLAVMEPEVFVDQVLVGLLRAAYIVCGFDFRFGHQARGDAVLLKQLGHEYGFAVDVVAAKRLCGQPIASTRIRRALACGAVEEAARLLGRCYTYRGRVVAGSQRGRLLGYPTANIALQPDVILPKDGVYVTTCLLESGRQYNALASIGVNPTFPGSERSLEVYLLEYAGDLYGQHVEVQFLQRLRDVHQYSSAEQLQAQIAADLAQAERVFSHLRTC